MNLSSKLLEQAVEVFSTLPGIGRKTALRLALHLVRQPVEHTEQFSEALLQMRRNIKYCTVCHNLSDNAVCAICMDKRRDEGLVCVVETIRDVMAIEDTNQYQGLYHVLGGIISPIEGIGPSDLSIDALIDRVAAGGVRELIMAISPTIEGETTIFYIAKKLRERQLEVHLSAIARGVAFGGELEYTDELTLGRSIVTRVAYQVKD